MTPKEFVRDFLPNYDQRFKDEYPDHSDNQENKFCEDHFEEALYIFSEKQRIVDGQIAVYLFKRITGKNNYDSDVQWFKRRVIGDKTGGSKV